VSEAEAISTETEAQSAKAPKVESTPPVTSKTLARAAGWEVGGQVVSLVIRLGSNLILTRLLTPEIFGLMALLHGLFFVMALLSDVGITQAVLVSRREDDDFLNTAWTMHSVRGLGLWLVSCAIAWPCGILLSEPRLSWLLPIGSIATLLSGFQSVKPWLLRRRMRSSTIAKLELFDQVQSVLILIVLAKLGFGIMATVGGMLISGSIRTILSYTPFYPIKAPRPRFTVDQTAKQEILNFGRWIFFSSCLTAVINKGDQLLLTRLVGAAQLGLYQTALVLAEVPDMLVGRIVSGVLLPALARVKNSTPAQFADEYYRVRLWLDAVTQTAIGGLIGMSDWVIGFLYDDRYAGAGAMMRVLAIRTAIHVSSGLCETALFAHGKTSFGFRRNVFVSAFTLLAMPIGHHLGGTQGLLWGTVLGRLTALPALSPAARENGMLRLSREALPLLWLGLGYGLGVFFVWLLPTV